MTNRLAILAALALGMAFAPDAAQAQTTEATGPDDSRVAQGATLLATHLEHFDHRGWMLPAGSIFSIAAGGLGMVAAAMADGGSDGIRTGVIAGSGVLLFGGLGGLVAEDALAQPILAMGVFGGAGILFTGSGLDSDSSQMLPAGLGYLGSTALLAISTLIRPPVTPRVLAADYHRICTPQQRARLSAAELAAMERRYRMSETAIPMRFIHLPAVLGVASTTFIHAHNAATETGEIAMNALGITVLAVGALTFLLPTPYERYERELQDTGLALQVVPGLGSLHVTGTF